MSRFCRITFKKSIKGNFRSHAMNISKRKFLPNLHVHKFWVSKQNRFVSIRVSAKGMRIINKKGIDYFI